MSYEITITCEHGRAGTHKIMEDDFEHSDGIHTAIISVWLDCPECGTVGTEDAQLIRIEAVEEIS